MDSPFVVGTDASDYGVGAVLLQPRNDVLMLCRYAMRDSERKEEKIGDMGTDCEEEESGRERGEGTGKRQQREEEKESGVTDRQRGCERGDN
ncbi:hypothetical protein PoB_000669600 [Plakobranchus ocellatus]|uniref:Reverse transcriptase RNase H-like domain-containing protein n=1 Tax=Plakobranchus ocellatus TaxID=259542 RepID=A0AAV3YAD3_9GAST|nr:hypothetical protein PoB_000669600 [Plakobranchus ocellatus]